MAELIYKTRGNSSPQGKPKVYFACRPCDAYLFDQIANEILSIVDCAIFCAKDKGFDEDEHFQNLSEMNLFVLPVTSNLLSVDCYVTAVEVPFAQMHHIPILPLMQEDGLSELFNQKCGDLQYLDKNAHDTGAISYEEKLRNFLEATLVSGALAEKIRQAFDAYIFLSYRKKDRLYAKELMQLIHENDFCRDIAIWYDEFLTPGEDFNRMIEDALKKSALFVLAVTPNIVNEENYVMSVEYPMARDTKKTVLPIELVPTNREELEKAYRDIREAVNSKNAEALRDALRDAFQWITLRYRDDDPEHNYLIGLAYLSGVDVEKNPTRALELITQAAESNHPEAIEKLVTMYENGEGVKRDLEAAIGWRERLSNVYANHFVKNETEANAHLFAISEQNLGDAYRALGMFDKARTTFQHLLDNSKLFTQSFGWKSLAYYQTTAYNRLGDIAQDNLDYNTAKHYYSLSKEVCREIIKTDPCFKARDALALTHEKLGNLFYLRAEDTSNWNRDYDLIFSQKEYAAAVEIRESLINETDKVNARHGLANLYLKLGDLTLKHGSTVSMEDYAEARMLEFFNFSFEEDEEKASAELKGDRTAALEFYRKALTLLETVAAELDSIPAQNDLAFAYQKISQIEPSRDLSYRYYQKARSIWEDIFAKVPTIEAKRTLATCYFHDPNRTDAMLQRAISYFEAIVRDRDSIAARQDLATCYLEQGNLAEKESSQRRAYQKALALLTANAMELGTTKSLYELAEVYQKLAAIAAQHNNTQGTAHDYYLNTVALFEMTTGYEQSNLILLKAYDAFGDFANRCGDFKLALFCYQRALLWTERLNDTPSRQNLPAYRNKVETFRAKHREDDEKAFAFPLSFTLIEEIAEKIPSTDQKHALYEKLSAIAFDHQNIDLQLYFWKKAIALHELRVAKIKTLEKKRDLANDFSRLGSTLWRHGKRTEALEAYLRAIEIATELAEEKGTCDAYEYVGSLHHEVSYWYIQDKEPALALPFEERAYAIWKAVAEADPKYSYLCDLSKERLDFLT